MGLESGCEGKPIQKLKTCPQWCRACEKKYVGETKGALNIRMNWHRDDRGITDFKDLQLVSTSARHGMTYEVYLLK